MTATCLIPLDGSEPSTQVLGPLQALLRVYELEPVLVTVVGERTPAEQEAECDAGEAMLQKMATQVKGWGSEVQTRLVRGDAADQILALADELDSKLIAMTTHGRTGLSRMVRGSVAERVLRYAKQPLLLCNPTLDDTQPDGFPRILVPLDGSERAERVLEHVEQLAKAYGSSITLLRVEPFLYSAIPSPAIQPEMWDARITRASLDPAKVRLEQAGIKVEVKAAYGVEAAEILSAAHEADLVVMSSHGRSGPSRWWFGSVAESVLRHCERPLFVVRGD